MKNSTLFITYNPNQLDEQTLAIRLHTIGTANGFRIFLPDRFNSAQVLDSETQRRIDESDYFIIFSLASKLSKTVEQEINYAWQRFNDKSKIIVIYHAKKGKNLNHEASKKCTEIYFDPLEHKMDGIIHKIMETIFQKEESKKKNKEIEEGLVALLGIGLGLLILNELTKK